MNTIREQSRNPIVVGIAGFVIGALFGLVVLGWWIWPVQWTDATPAELSMTWQEEFLHMTIVQYGVDGDVAQAQANYAALGDAGPEALQMVAQDPQGLSPELIASFTAAVSGQPVAPVVGTPAAGTPVATAAAGEAGRRRRLPDRYHFDCLDLHRAACYRCSDRLRPAARALPSPRCRRCNDPRRPGAGKPPPNSANRLYDQRLRAASCPMAGILYDRRRSVR